MTYLYARGDYQDPVSMAGTAGGVLLLILLIAVGILLVFLPIMIATQRQITSRGWVIVLTFLFWPGALILACFGQKSPVASRPPA